MTDTLPRETEPADASGGERATSTADRWLGLVLLAAAVAALGLLAGVPALLMVLAIVVSIFLHELGHYLVARWAGMKVTEFFIGFGPKLWSFRRGETEYGVKLIFAGAYVRIIGMSDLEEIDPADEPRTYRAQPYLKRLPVVLAGPFANFAVALVLLFVVFGVLGTPREDDWRVGMVEPASAAAAAGVEPGDRIVSVDGRPVPTWDDLVDAVQPTAGEPTTIVVDRDGEILELTVTLGWRLSEEAAGAVTSVGVDGADAHPLRRGDRIVAVGGEPVATYGELAEKLRTMPAGETTITFARGSELPDDRRTHEYVAERVKVPVELPAAGYTGFFGIGREVDADRLPPHEAVVESGKQFGFLTAESVKGIVTFFSPSGLGRYADVLRSTPPGGAADTVVAEPIVHPVESTSPPPAQDPAQVNADRPSSILGIVRLGSQAAEGGAVQFLLLLVVVNVFLGLFNLLPLPPLDGGHAAVATYEEIRGRVAHRAYRVQMAKLMPLTYVVVLLLVGLFVTSTYLDIVDPAPNPFEP